MRKVGHFSLLPAQPGTCPDCAVEHDPRQPHNAQSLFYKYAFYADHGRWPTWGDAMAHCGPEMQERWKEELLKTGHVQPEELEPSK